MILDDDDKPALREFIAIVERFHTDLGAWVARHPGLIDPRIMAELVGVDKDARMMRAILDGGFVPDVGNRRGPPH